MTEKELYKLKDIFLQLGKLVLKYGGKYYTIQIKVISDIIECIRFRGN